MLHHEVIFVSCNERDNTKCRCWCHSVGIKIKLEVLYKINLQTQPVAGEINVYTFH